MKTSKMLDLNIDHLSNNTISVMEDWAKLQAHGKQSPLRVVSHRFGFIVYPSDVGLTDNIPVELREINNKAYKAGCFIINFDCDSGWHDEFVIFKDREDQPCLLS